MTKYIFKIIFVTAMMTGMGAKISAENAMAAEYAVVVNSANGLSGSEDDLRGQIQRIFMKQQTSWPGNIAAFPLDRSSSSAEHVAFLKNILGKSEQEMASHWLSVKQQQGTTPPRTVGSTRILLRLIGKKEGGMGVVNVTDLDGAPATVKVLFRFND